MFHCAGDACLGASRRLPWAWSQAIFGPARLGLTPYDDPSRQGADQRSAPDATTSSRPTVNRIVVQAHYTCSELLVYGSPRSDSNRRPSDYESKSLRPAGAIQARSGCSRQRGRLLSAFLTRCVTAGGMTKRTTRLTHGRLQSMATFRSDQGRSSTGEPSHRPSPDLAARRSGRPAQVGERRSLLAPALTSTQRSARGVACRPWRCQLADWGGCWRHPPQCRCGRSYPTRRKKVLEGSVPWGWEKNEVKAVPMLSSPS